jgi:hypothetical protein
MLVATRAILLPFHALRVEALVLHGEVVPVFALATGEDDFFAGHFMFLEFCLPASAFRAVFPLPSSVFCVKAHDQD